MRKHQVLAPGGDRRWLLAVTAITVGGIAQLGVAAPTFTDFKNNDKLSAETMNDNFKFVLDKLREHAGSPCNATQAFPTGAVGGYLVAKGLCEQACGMDALAHVCTSDEVAHAAQSGSVMPSGRIATGAYANIGGAQMNDCGGFTVSDNAQVGAVWESAAQAVVEDGCGNPKPLLCCN